MISHSNASNPLANCPLCKKDEATFRNLEIDGHMYTAVCCKACGLIGPQYYTYNKNAANLARILWNNNQKNPSNKPSQ